jgi:hypothetical protein
LLCSSHNGHALPCHRYSYSPCYCYCYSYSYCYCYYCYTHTHTHTYSHRYSSADTRADEFSARSPDELSLRRGDRIELVERDDDFGDGWFLGKNTESGENGLFPEGM